jgi:cytochrome c peroxidase
MKRIAAALVFCLLPAQAHAAPDAPYDRFLERIIRTYNLRPLPTKPFEETHKFKLGRALFFDPVLSGNRDISCGTCHLHGKGLSDGLAFAIGTGGKGLGENRKPAAGRPQQPRNALDLWNRDNNWVKSMFWDGGIEVLDPVKRVFRSPLGARLPGGFENVMAVQAVFPLAREDEMLGSAGDRSPADLPGPHANRENEFAGRTVHLKGEERIEAILGMVMKRLLGGGDSADKPWQEEYAALFRAAYPNRAGGKFSIADFGNAIAHFEEIAFATRHTPWDEYLAGNRSAIGDRAKKGAFIFYGKARCAVCHEGPLFSDFRFHSIGVRNSGPGLNGSGDDPGRSEVSNRESDKYKFRTPPLRNVTLSAPYFHNGSAATLREALWQHLDPLFYADKYRKDGTYEMNVAQIESISAVVTMPAALSGDEIEALIAFLGALEDRESARTDRIVPSAVPSGLPVSVLRAAPSRSK